MGHTESEQDPDRVHFPWPVDKLDYWPQNAHHQCMSTSRHIIFIVFINFIIIIRNCTWRSATKSSLLLSLKCPSFDCKRSI